MSNASRGTYMNVLGSKCVEAFEKARVLTHSDTREHSPQNNLLFSSPHKETYLTRCSPQPRA